MNKLINVIIGIVFTVFLLFLFSKHLNSIFFPFANEYREGHTYSSTVMLLRGENPFSISSYPAFYNSYGILFNIVVLPFAFIFGNSLILHRLISAFFIFAILFVVFRNSFIKREFSVFNLICFVLLYSGLIYGPGGSVRPDNLGVFLFICSIIIPVNNHFDKRSLVLSMLFGLLSFYTKPYYFIGWISISIYMFLFVSYKRALLLNFLFAIFFLLIGFLVSKLFPMYFYEVIFSYTNDAKSNLIMYSVKQLKHFLYYILPFLPIFMSYLIMRGSLKSILKNPYFVISIIIFLFLIYPLGLNLGAFLTYHFQLLLPILCLFLMTFQDEKFESLKSNQLVLLLAIGFFYLFSTKYIGIGKSKDDIGTWSKMSSYIDTKQNVLVGPLLAPMIMDKNRELYENGVSSYVFLFKSKAITKSIFSLDEKILERKESFITDINSKIKKKYFDAIISSPDIDRGIYPLIDKSKYSLVKTVYLTTPHDGVNYKLNVFEPIK